MLGTKLPVQPGIFGNKRQNRGLDREHFSSHQCRLKTKSFRDCKAQNFKLQSSKNVDLSVSLVEWDLKSHFNLKIYNNKSVISILYSCEQGWLHRRAAWLIAQGPMVREALSWFNALLLPY